MFQILQNESFLELFTKRDGAVFLYSSEKTQLDLVGCVSPDENKQATSSTEKYIWARLITEIHGTSEKSYIFLISEILPQFHSIYKGILIKMNISCS